MENFRKKLQKNNVIYLLFMLVSAAGLVMVNTSLLPEKISDAASVHSGLFGALLAISALSLVRNKKALSDEKSLKAMYIRNTDERNSQMMKEVSKTTFTIILAGLAIATIVSQYFSEIVSSTLSCCMAFILIVYFGVTFYYNRKM